MLIHLFLYSFIYFFTCFFIHIIYFLLFYRQICLRFYSLKCGPMYLPFYEFQKRWARKAITTVGEAFTLMLREIPGNRLSRIISILNIHDSNLCIFCIVTSCSFISIKFLFYLYFFSIQEILFFYFILDIFSSKDALWLRRQR